LGQARRAFKLHFGQAEITLPQRRRFAAEGGGSRAPASALNAENYNHSLKVLAIDMA
jgi:hypothetical protein